MNRGEPAGTVVPDTIGLDATAACESVRAAGLIPSGPLDEAQPAGGTVVEQTPQPGATVPADSTVVLRIHPGGESGGKHAAPDPAPT
jgi:beta-lactam-binding protein with PASTA domain